MSEERAPAGRGVPNALRRAMKVFSNPAQAQYRAKLRILLALEEQRNADLSSEARRPKEEEKSRNLSKRTIENGNSTA